MKFSWYRWLPEDFRQRYHGVWVDLPNALYDPERGQGLSNEYLDILEYADQTATVSYRAAMRHSLPTRSPVPACR